MRKPARHKPVRFTRSPISLAVLSMFGGIPAAFAQTAPPPDEGTQFDEVIVTATRRSQDIQDLPMNISAVSGDDIDRQGIQDLADLTRIIPGIFLVNQGARAASLMVVRGLNTSSIAASEGLGNSSGGVVATYVGDIPLYVDLKLFDMDRVEALLGPQGTLYGAGTLGGALRYIPNRPDTDESSLKVDLDGFGRSHSDGFGSTVTVAMNQPIVKDALAVRAAAGYFYDPGFIDYGYLVREMGVSDPEPVFSDPNDVAANLRREEDADDAETKALRLSLGWELSETVRADLAYHWQNQHVGGRTINSSAAIGSGLYESGLRVLEPNFRENNLGSLELNADLGFATLTSATGVSRYDEHGQRDQTDLLLNFQYGYENFPSFVAFTRELVKEDTLNQEIRLVSREGKFNWIGGVFYNRFDTDASSEEFVPNYPPNAEPAPINRPDNLEYIQISYQTFTEKAVFGEVGFDLTDHWTTMVGARWFDFEDKQEVGFDLPLLNGTPDQVFLNFSANSISDDDVVFKFNTSYEFSDDLLTYLTISEGYRSGGVNAVPPCQDPLPPGQNVCALPNEQLVKPDKTLNHEIGVRSAWAGGRLVLNGAVYVIDWTDVQVAGTTVNGAVPITVNAAEARSQGFELTTRLKLLDALSLRANYSYNKAELTKDAPGIIEGFDAFKGDRLPASPEHQGNLALLFEQTTAGGLNLTADYAVFAISDVYTRAGLRADGDVLGGFAVHRAAMGVANGPWSVRLYANNLFDKYAETGVRSTRAGIRDIPTNDAPPDDSFRLRRYYVDVLEPLTVGLLLSYDLY